MARESAIEMDFKRKYNPRLQIQGETEEGQQKGTEIL